MNNWDLYISPIEEREEIEEEEKELKFKPLEDALNDAIFRSYAYFMSLYNKGIINQNNLPHELYEIWLKRQLTMEDWGRYLTR